MSIATLVDRNIARATKDVSADLPQLPSQGVVIITCIDHRVEPADFLELSPGEAVVLRNVGGRVTETVIGDLAFLSHLAVTFLGDGARMPQVLVVHHTGCGSAALANDAFREGLAGLVGGDADELREAAVTDPSVSVGVDVQRILHDPRLMFEHVRGGVYDLATGRLTLIDRKT